MMILDSGLLFFGPPCMLSINSFDAQPSVSFSIANRHRPLVSASHCLVTEICAGALSHGSGVRTYNPK